MRASRPLSVAEVVAPSIDNLVGRLTNSELIQKCSKAIELQIVPVHDP